ncbi:MAG: histidine kinase [Actinomycetota bacterium]|nr:histidine kinase [Actinomycetota bacterium]
MPGRGGPALPWWSPGRYRRSTEYLVPLLLLAVVIAEDVTGKSVGWRIAADLLLVIPLLWRRRLPVTTYLVVQALALAFLPLAVPPGGVQAIAVAVYGVAIACPRRLSLTALIVSEAALAAEVARWGTQNSWLLFGLLASMLASIWATGTTTQVRRTYLESLQRRAVELERDQQRQAELAAANERARISRDIHDIVAHNLSVMVALADGAEYVVTNDPGGAVEAVRMISRTGRQALAEMRSELEGISGRGEVAYRPQPGLADLETLVAAVRRTGLPITFVTTGEVGEISAGAQLALYRAVQEALTNTLKHAGPEATATVRMDVTAEQVTLEISNVGRGDDGSAAEPRQLVPGQVAVQPAQRRLPASDGRGLAGMRDRLALYGAELDVTPTRTGWTVRATLPVGSSREPDEHA